MLDQCTLQLKFVMVKNYYNYQYLIIFMMSKNLLFVVSHVTDNNF